MKEHERPEGHEAHVSEPVACWQFYANGLLAQAERYEKALQEILACDYRGNRPPEQDIAERALDRLT